MVCHMTSNEMSSMHTHTVAHTHTHTHTFYSIFIASDKQNLASTTLESQRALEYFATNEDSLDLFLRFLNDPAIILTHGAELTKIFELSSKDKSTNQEEGDTEKDASSGEGNLSSDNLTEN